MQGSKCENITMDTSVNLNNWPQGSSGGQCPSWSWENMGLHDSQVT